MCSQEAFHANLTALPENGWEKMTPGISGPKCLEQFGKLNPLGWWAKTFAACLIGKKAWFSTKCKLTWKLQDMKYSRFYFQLQASTLRTKERESGFLPTAKASDGMRGGSVVTDGRIRRKTGQTFYPGLTDLAKSGLLPTPISSDAIIGKNDVYKMTSGLPRKYNQNGKDGSVGLARLVQLLPTPTVREYKGGRHPETLAKAGRSASNSLGDTINAINGQNSQLNPRFVLEMMGFPTDWTALPFQNGEKKASKVVAMP